MKINKAKNYVGKIVAAMFCLAMLVYGRCGYAGMTTRTIEIPCSEDFQHAPWIEVGRADSRTQYAITSKGIRMNDIPDLITQTLADIHRIPSEYLERDDIYLNIICGVHIEAKCTSQHEIDNYFNLWPPGTSYTCAKGDGLMLKMFRPNDINPDKYHFVGELTVVTDEDKTDEKEIANAVNSTATSEVVGHERTIVLPMTTGLTPILDRHGKCCTLM